MARSRTLLRASIVAAAVTFSATATVVAQAPSASPSAAGGVVTISDGEGFAGAQAHAIAVGADGSLVMGGGTGPDPGRPDNAVAWHSVDGTSWTQAILPDSAGLSAHGVVETPDGWVAIVTQPLMGGGLV